MFNRASDVARDMFAGAAAGGVTGAIVGGTYGGSACTLVAPGVGTVACGGAGVITGAVAGATIGAGAALAHDLSVVYRDGGGTPRQAQGKVRKGQGPKDIVHIHKSHGQPGGQWHVHTRDGGAINLDGTKSHAGPGNIAKKSLDWLRNHGWKL